MNNHKPNDPFDNRGPAYRVPAHRPRKIASWEKKFAIWMLILGASQAWAAYGDLGGCGSDGAAMCYIYTDFWLLFTAFISTLAAIAAVALRQRLHRYILILVLILALLIVDSSVFLLREFF
jgi:hypothetical protein